MDLNKKPLTVARETIKLNEVIIDAIKDIKGSEIVSLDLRDIDDAPTDFFIICQGDSNTQIKAISENVSKRVKEDLRVRPNHIEGEKSARWILVDFFNTVVHIFTRETRDFYDLEDLWSDAVVTEYADVG